MTSIRKYLFFAISFIAPFALMLGLIVVFEETLMPIIDYVPPDGSFLDSESGVMIVVIAIMGIVIFFAKLIYRWLDENVLKQISDKGDKS